MALVPTLLALAIGAGLGLRWGGRLENLLEWRPEMPAALVGGVAAAVLLDVASPGGALGAVLALASMGALLAFAVLNLRIGGMVLVAAGVGLNLVVTLLNGAMPVSPSALVSAGVVGAEELDSITLTGGRELADGAILGFLGGIVPLPWGHIVSIGDLVALVGVALVTASVMRRYQVPGGRPSFRSGSRYGSTGGPDEYQSALDALARGPAPRRGPGLHPSRLTERNKSAGAQRRRPGTRPR